METSTKLRSLFPTAADIPAEYDLTEPLIQKQYLLDGEMVAWSGKMQDVYSPILVRNGDALTPKYLGAYPLIGEKEAVEALDSAMKAYDNGRGVWPTMSVEDRIECVEKFTKMMLGFRSFGQILFPNRRGFYRFPTSII